MAPNQNLPIHKTPPLEPWRSAINLRLCPSSETLFSQPRRKFLHSPLAVRRTRLPLPRMTMRPRRRGCRSSPLGRPKTLRAGTIYTGWVRRPTTWTSPLERGLVSSMTFSPEIFSAETVTKFSILNFILFYFFTFENPRVLIEDFLIYVYTHTHNFLAADIVFDYRQKVTRSFEYLQGDYYIAPVFMVFFIFVNFNFPNR